MVAVLARFDDKEVFFAGQEIGTEIAHDGTDDNRRLFFGILQDFAEHTRRRRLAVRARDRDGARRARHLTERFEVRHLRNFHFFRTRPFDITFRYRVAVNEKFGIRGNEALFVPGAYFDTLLHEHSYDWRFFAVGARNLVSCMVQILGEGRHPYSPNPDHVDARW